MLLKRLEYSFDISEKVLTCVKLYFTDITRCSSVTDITLLDVRLHFEVPRIRFTTKELL